MKKILSLFIAVLWTISPLTVNAVSVSAESAVLMNGKSGEVLYSKNADERRGPASTTKIMTALVAIENCSIDKMVTISPEAVGVEGSSVYLKAKEKISMESLLYALLLSSANDAAAAIAYEVAGGIPEFAELMNEKAASLGLENTHFSNPHGLDDAEHYTTARDLALIARAALENETFSKIVSTKKKLISIHDGEESRLLVNHNRLLFEYDDVVGVKTGYTKRCGRTLVSAAEKDGVFLIAVTLSDGNDWRDHRAMLDYGYEKIECVTLCKAGDFCRTLHVCGGEMSDVSVCTRDCLTVVLPKDRGRISAELELPKFLYAPVCSGQAVGRVVFSLDGKTIGIADVITSGDVEIKNDNGKGFLFWKK